MNYYAELKKILPDPPLQSGTVVAFAGGVATVQLPGGGTIDARGEATVGDKVYVRNSVIEGEAPNLPLEVIDVDAT